MRLTLQPNGGSGRRHEPTSYIVELPGSDSAVIDRVEGQGWHLTIRRHGNVINRGLFGSTHDILALLDAEYFPQDQSDQR